MEWTSLAAVSFARTPLAEIGGKVREITALGWVEEDRGDPWAVTFRKVVPEGEANPEAELHRVMGDYWLDAGSLRTLLDSK
jgi:hypothetical protein